MNNPLVSIIVPVYNVEDYLVDCLNSIASQAYTNIEAIFIDDGSTDKSSNILDEFQKKHAIKVIHQDNRGVSAARNVGIENSTGEFITFVDADDIISSDYISSLLSMMEDSVDVTMCGFNQINENIEVNSFQSNNLISDSIHIGSEQTLLEIFYGTVLDSGPFCKLYRRKVIGDVRYDCSLKIGEDLEFICRIFENNNLNVVYTEQPLYGYRTRNNSAMTDSYSSKYYDYFVLVKKISDRLTKKYLNIIPAVEYRLFGIASFGIGKMGKEYNNFIDEYKDYNYTLKTLSKGVLTGPRSSIKNRILSMGYTVSASTTSWVRCRLISWRV